MSSRPMPLPATRSSFSVRARRRLGRALYSDRSQIALRVLTRLDEDAGPDLWRRRIDAALRFRQSLGIEATAMRLVHGEADLLPSLIVDRYADWLVVQALSQGVDRLLPSIVAALVEMVRPAGVLAQERSASPAAGGPRAEGGGACTGRCRTRLRSSSTACSYDVDPWRGQKTGLFLDQRENRAAAAQYARGRLLDAFSYTGGFALTLAPRCEEVVALDISRDAVARIARNAEANGVHNVVAREVNVFDELRHFERSGDRFDTIVLDPPAFAKNKAAVPKAVAGYKDINLRALRILKPGGTLVTCSCSYNVDEALFYEILHEAAADARAPVTVLEKRMQGRDHPVLLGRARDVLFEVLRFSGSSSDVGVARRAMRATRVRGGTSGTMGQELHCIATWNDRRSVGTASLETEELALPRRVPPADAIQDHHRPAPWPTGASPSRWSKGPQPSTSGPRAEQWAERIRNPKSVLEKMGIKPRALVSVLGHRRRVVSRRSPDRAWTSRASGQVARNSDVIIVAINTARDLAAFDRAAGQPESERRALGGAPEGDAPRSPRASS